MVSVWAIIALVSIVLCFILLSKKQVAWGISSLLVPLSVVIGMGIFQVPLFKSERLEVMIQLAKYFPDDIDIKDEIRACCYKLLKSGRSILPHKEQHLLVAALHIIDNDIGILNICTQWLQIAPWPEIAHLLSFVDRNIFLILADKNYNACKQRINHEHLVDDADAENEKQTIFSLLSTLRKLS